MMDTRKNNQFQALTSSKVMLQSSVAFLLFLGSCNYEEDTELQPIEQSSTGEVSMYVTTPDRTLLLKELPNKLNFQDEDEDESSKAGGLTIVIDENDERQLIEGFGGALTGASAKLLHNNQVALDILFSAQDLNLSYTRIVSGSSDFSTIGNYTYDDTNGAEDLELNQFSLANDFLDDNPKIPVANQILAINPQMKFMSSAWSAPAWMKSNGNLEGGFLLPQYYNVYANYWERYLQEYAANGINIDALTVQNEPLFENNYYPTMYMTAQQQADFIGDHLGPKLAANNSLSPKIIAYDHNFWVQDDPDYPLTVLGDAQASQYTNAVGYHAYGGNPNDIDQLTNQFPNAEVYFTEQSGIENDNTTFQGEIDWFMKNVFIGTLRKGAKAILLWNLALDENNGPTNGGCDVCRGVLQITSGGSIIKQPEYYMFGHFSKFVQPGAVVLGTNELSGQFLNVAFRNPDGSKVLVLYNASGATGQDRRVKVQVNGKRFTYAVPGGSVTTFIWN